MYMYYPTYKEDTIQIFFFITVNTSVFIVFRGVIMSFRKIKQDYGLSILLMHKHILKFQD